MADSTEVQSESEVPSFTPGLAEAPKPMERKPGVQPRTRFGFAWCYHQACKVVVVVAIVAAVIGTVKHLTAPLTSEAPPADDLTEDERTARRPLQYDQRYKTQIPAYFDAYRVLKLRPCNVEVSSKESELNMTFNNNWSYASPMTMAKRESITFENRDAVPGTWDLVEVFAGEAGRRLPLEDDVDRGRVLGGFLAWARWMEMRNEVATASDYVALALLARSMNLSMFEQERIDRTLAYCGDLVVVDSKGLFRPSSEFPRIEPMWNRWLNNISDLGAIRLGLPFGYDRPPDDIPEKTDPGAFTLLPTVGHYYEVAPPPTPENEVSSSPEPELKSPAEIAKGKGIDFDNPKACPERWEDIEVFGLDASRTLPSDNPDDRALALGGFVAWWKWMTVNKRGVMTVADYGRLVQLAKWRWSGTEKAASPTEADRQRYALVLGKAENLVRMSKGRYTATIATNQQQYDQLLGQVNEFLRKQAK